MNKTRDYHTINLHIENKILSMNRDYKTLITHDHKM